LNEHTTPVALEPLRGIHIQDTDSRIHQLRRRTAWLLGVFVRFYGNWPGPQAPLTPSLASNRISRCHSAPVSHFSR